MKTFRRIFRRLRIALERQHRKFRPIPVLAAEMRRNRAYFDRIKGETASSAGAADFIYSVPDAGCGD